MRILVILLCVSFLAKSQVRNTTDNKRYDEMPISREVWVTSKTMETFLIDYAVSAKTSFKIKFIDSLNITIPFATHKLLNPRHILIKSLDDKTTTLAPYKIDTVNKTVRVTFSRIKSGFLTIF